jgi:hypothetical protein
LHSVHQRLYVPYAFGTLYNHPVEGFLLNSLGALLSESIAGLSVRQAMLFLLLSTCKTVDDYCDYGLPFDRLQMFSSNTADYHNMHHQVIDSLSTMKSELMHRIMLVNLLRLLGAIKTKKASRQIVTCPTQVLLPSPITSWFYEFDSVHSQLSALLNTSSHATKQAKKLAQLF